MNKATTTAEEGYQLRVFSSMYLDFGLEISKLGKDLFYSPSCLSVENYGFVWDEENEEKEGISWSDKEWHECLESEADDFIEAYCSEYDVDDNGLGK